MSDGNLGRAPRHVEVAAGKDVGHAPSRVRIAKAARSAYKRKLPHFQPPGVTLFVTFATKDRWVLPDSARSIVMDACLHDHERRYILPAAVVMPDHVHLLLTPGRDEQGGTFGLGEILSGIKGTSAHAINKVLNRQGAVWQREFFDHVLRSDESLRSKAEYVCANPVRAGLVKEDVDYQWMWREWVEGTDS